MEALDHLSATEHGQRLFQDILANTHRQAPVTIRAKATSRPPAEYDPQTDEIIIDDGLLPLPPDLVEAHQEVIRNFGFDRMDILLLHEGDHAARMFGEALPPVHDDTFIDRVLAFACYEEHAIERVNAYRRELDLPERGAYVDFSESVEQASDELQAIFNEDRSAFLSRVAEIRFGLEIDYAFSVGCEEHSPEDVSRIAGATLMGVVSTLVQQSVEPSDAAPQMPIVSDALSVDAPSMLR